jgi:hypothetical protein
LYGLVALTVHGVQGQTPAAGEQKPTAPSTAAENTSEEHQQKLAIGFRARILPFRSFSVMDNREVLNTTTVSKVNYDFNYSTVNHSFMLGGGLTLEGRISRRTLVTAELLYNRVQYSKTTNMYWGVDDPTTAADERSHQTTTESTKARLFDLPVLVERNLRSTGFLSHLYLAAGPTARLVSTVHTTTNITYADATKGNNSIPAPIAKRLLVGGTVGVGLRFVDEFNIKVTPEVRYTRWNGTTFNQDSTRSPRNQLEIGIGFSR